MGGWWMGKSGWMKGWLLDEFGWMEEWLLRGEKEAAPI